MWTGERSNVGAADGRQNANCCARSFARDLTFHAEDARGELKAELDRLAAKHWQHPAGGWTFRCARSTIERWYYRALNEPRHPVGVLARKARVDRGRSPSVAAPLAQELQRQYKAHPNWSYRLHAGNLAVTAAQHPQLGRTPLDCFLRDKDVARPAPDLEQLHLALNSAASRWLLCSLLARASPYPDLDRQDQVWQPGLARSCHVRAIETSHQHGYLSLIVWR